MVIDFGGQYAHLITRRIRELGVYSELLAASSIATSGLPDRDRIKGIILSGGPKSVWEADHDAIAKLAIESGVPVLGICYGHQLLGKVLGGQVGRSPRPEFGPTMVEVLSSSSILRGFPKRIKVWMSHYDAVLEPPPGAKTLARSGGSPVAAFDVGGTIFGVQWHPEVEHSELGLELLSNFIEFTGLARDWKPGNLIEDLVSYVREKVGDGTAIAAVSGGIDSTVATVIASRALGGRLKPVLIDHGLHPSGEVERVIKLLSGLGLNVVVLNEEERFLDELRGVEDPEEKRSVIGRVYGEVLKEFAERVGAEFLVQGTIYPDVIESGARPGADTIKTHHNVGGLPEDLGLELVEPLRYFYKDEVRELARVLGIPRERVVKQPVPGPGLAVRVEGEVTREKLRILRRVDEIVRDEVEAWGLSEKLWQYFAVLTRSRATGVRGDSRSYGYVVAIRAVESSDAMTARPARLPWDLLEYIASRVTGEVPEVVRVVYDVTSKPPATIEWE